MAAEKITNSEGYYYDKSPEGRVSGEKQVVRFLNELICHGCECSDSEVATQETEVVTQEAIMVKTVKITDSQLNQYLSQGYIQ